MLGEAQALFAVPIILRIQDGLQQQLSQHTDTLLDKMAAMCVGLAKKGNYSHFN